MTISIYLSMPLQSLETAYFSGTPARKRFQMWAQFRSNPLGRRRSRDHFVHVGFLYRRQCPTELNVIRTSHTRAARGSVQKPNVTTPNTPNLYTLYHSQTNVTRHNSRIVPADMDGWTRARARRRSAELVAGLCQEGGKSGHSLLVRSCSGSASASSGTTAPNRAYE